MKENQYIYQCPVSLKPLKLKIQEKKGDDVIVGELLASNGMKYKIQDGVADFIYPPNLQGIQKQQQEYYDNAANSYDDVANLTFDIQKQDERKVRISLIELLKLKKNSKVLEISCGTGRDSINIAGKLGRAGEFFVQDLSRKMLLQCRRKLISAKVPVEYSLGNACYLPFPDGYFDAVFSFGGLSVFGDIKKALKEMARVTKLGGKVVAGDESLAPWLYDSEFGKILLNNNPLFKSKIPFESIPIEARDVAARWILNGVYYVLEFMVGEGEPKGNFDLKIPGVRGGTLNTRYHGRLEGVDPQIKELVLKAVKKSKKSQHDWLNAALKKAAQKEL